MNTLKLRLTDMGHGGAAIGRDKKNRVIFVPFGIPGELVEIEVEAGKKRYSTGTIKKILEPSPDRVKRLGEAVLGPHGGLLYQHMSYAAQLKHKRQVVADQLRRIGGLTTDVKPVIAAPEEWEYDTDITLSPTQQGGFGFWSPEEQAVIPIRRCPTAVPILQDLITDFDLELPDLRRMTLRAGYDDNMLVALEINHVEPPSLHVDFPISVTIVLPDRTTANLIGENFITRQIKDREFQISAGCDFNSNTAVTEQLVDVVLRYAAPAPTLNVLELYSGVGTLTAFLAPLCKELVGIEINPDAIEDAARNLADTENVSLYQGWVEDTLPLIETPADIVVMDPPADGVPQEVIEQVVEKRPRRIIYISRDVATLARDGKRLSKSGYKLREVQPLDMLPQTFHIYAVAVWSR